MTPKVTDFNDGALALDSFYFGCSRAPLLSSFFAQLGLFNFYEREEAV
jgi:hypothetical protein